MDDGPGIRRPTVAGEALDPGESPKARLDRELIELLNEVRVALPGAQVLFAFLLVLPFQAAFAPARRHPAGHVRGCPALERGGHRAAHRALVVSPHQLPATGEGEP